MASASQNKTRFLSQKLTFLKDQGDQLNSAVGLYVSGIIEAGEAWTEGGDNKIEYIELCQMIDNAVVLLCEKCEELAGASRPLTTPATTAHRQPAAPLISSATTFHTQPTEPVQPADETMLEPVLARIAAIEETLTSFRSNAEKVAEQQSGIDQQLKEIFSKLSESDKKHNSKWRKVKEQFSEISDTQVALDQEHETRLQSLEEQLQKLSTAQDRMEVEMKSQAELTEKLVHVPDQMESVNEKLDVLDARIGRIIDDCSNKHQDIENVTRDLADKVMANTENAQHQTKILLKELETRMQTLEAESGRNVKDVQKLAEKGETYRSQVIQELSIITPRLQQLEVKACRTRCGFTAWSDFSGGAAGDLIKQYKSLVCNVGGNFDAGSGIFTAPVDGLYVASASLYLHANGDAVVGVRYNKQGQASAYVCLTSTVMNGSFSCTVGVVDMKAGDTLSSCVYRNNGTYSNKELYFSGFLLT